MHIPWEAVQLFLAAAEHASLAKAAKALGVTQPTVSRRLAELESTLGEPLFVRSVEGVTLTAAGERLLGPARMMAEAYGEVSRVAAGTSAVPSGIVHVSAPPGIAYELLAPLAVTMRKALPEVRLSVNATVRQVDLVRREADLALRGTKPVTRDLVTLASIEEPVAVFGSRAYVRSLPSRPSLEDLAWIAWPASHADIPPNPQLAARIPDFAPAFAADDFLVQLRAAQLGAGAVILSASTSRLAGKSGLVRIDLGLGPLKVGLHLVCARSALAIPRVRAVADLLAAELTRAGRVPREEVG
ncbi:MAG: LysR family transcriptional regulator [Deltaproteobacteria bacterium]|nr:LysR family transcriptional regulator [Deltaproteobacteria bacterium]